MTCNSDGSNPRRFFGRSSPASSGQARLTRRSRNDHCNCDPYASVGNAVTLDRSLRDVPQLLWIDGSHGHIWSADLGGCNCTLVVNATEMQNAGLPPTSLTADKSFIYWSNSSAGKIYCFDKTTLEVVYDASPGQASAYVQPKRRVVSETARGIRGIRAIGDHLQPYPDAVCLAPPKNVDPPTLISASSNGLVIKLTVPERPPECEKISLASVKYTLFYGIITPDNVWQCAESLHGCKTLVCAWKTFVELLFNVIPA